MQALILAAGMGSRLGPHTRELPKTLVPVHGVPILEHALSILMTSGVESCILGVGYRADTIQDRIGGDFLGVPVEYVENPDFATTNNVTTMHRCLARVEGPVITLEGDILFRPELLNRLLDGVMEERAVVSPAGPHMDGTMVTLGDGGTIEAFVPREEQEPRRSNYLKTVNIYRFSSPFVHQVYRPALARQLESGGNQVYYESVLGQLVREGAARMEGVVVPASHWAEVDTPEDLLRAERLGFPAPVLS